MIEKHYRNHEDSSQVATLLGPSRRAAKGGNVRNFHRENLMAMKQK